MIKSNCHLTRLDLRTCKHLLQVVVRACRNSNPFEP